jgi:thymidine kinase
MPGKLTVITGPMASGKTLELIVALKKEEIRGRKVLMVKSEIDRRNPDAEVSSRMGLSFPAIYLGTGYEIPEEADVVGIEEAQFFNYYIVNIVRRLLRNNVDVYVTGLNSSSKGKPFNGMQELLGIADDIKFLTAVCQQCGAPATRTQKLVDGQIETSWRRDIEVEGADETVVYEPRCNRCWEYPVGKISQCA